MPNFGDYQLELYFQGLAGVRHPLPMTYEPLERRAHDALTPEIVSYVAGGAGDERTQRLNVEAFDRWGLKPRMLRNTPERDLSIELFGIKLPSPVMLAPVGVIGLCAQDGHGDLATADAAAQSGVPMIASTLTQDPMEEVAKRFGDTPGFFQLYPPADRELCESFVRRAERSGFKGIVVTVDTWVPGWRPRDLSIGNFPQLHGLCLANYFSDPVFLAKLEKSPEEDLRMAAIRWALEFGNPTLGWDDISWLRSLTELPLVIKGIGSADDVHKAKELGVDGIYCSTHGGRQANGGLAAIEMLPDVVDAAGELPVIFDSGVRGGDHIVKALALGATAVAIGRPYCWGLALGGSAGVMHVLKTLLAEADLLMAIDGYPSVADLTPDALVDRYAR
jgi:lactate 2-monooxygenase